MTEYKKVFIDTAPFIYLIEKNEGNPQYYNKVRKFLNDGYNNDVDFVSSVITTEDRAEYQSFKAMDALQLAVASLADCNLFLTNDKQLKQFKELKCITVDELE